MAVKEAAQPRKSPRALIAVLVVLVLALSAAVGYLLLREKDAPEETPKRNVVVNAENLEQVAQEMQQGVEQGYYKVIMNTDWNFANGAVASEDAYVENSRDNRSDVYFDVKLTGSGETILESPVLTPGSYLTDITLDKDLDPGDYECDIVYHLVDENQETTSTLTMALTVHVLA